MTPRELHDLQQRYPFLSVVEYLKQEYLGIIQQADQQFISMYTWDNNWIDSRKKQFLLCGETWWWESNRNIPINLFLGKQFLQFRNVLKTFASKESSVVQGPVVNLRDMLTKRVKRRTITLVRDI
tara:strand:+ start:9095 stop:9469 length:375 start_codon:yes stop_codon:yes gene_type:complete